MPTFTVTCGDSLEILKQLPDRCVHSCVTDAPYGLSEHRPEDVVACLTAWLAGQEYRPKKKGFMNRVWDAWVPGPELWREVYRVLKPGGHVLAMAGSRTQDLMGMAIRLAGFEIRDGCSWIYASGFPKSHNISIAIDKQAGSMDHRGKRITVAGYVNDGGEMETGRSMPKHEGITEAAKQWDGWGTALKPAHEPIIVARKPLEGTVAANVVKYGTGGLNIDGCRVDGAPPKGYPNGPGGKSHHYSSDKRSEEVRPDAWEPSGGGRWPPNVLLSHARGCVQVGTMTIPGDARAGQEDKLGGTRPGGFGDVGAASGADKPNGVVYGPTEAPLWACVPGCPIRALDDQAGHRKSGAKLPEHKRHVPRLGHGGVYGQDAGQESTTAGRTFASDAGAVSRFFPILPIDDPTEAPFFYSSKTSPTERNDGMDEGDLNRHPTVKPTALMAWLCRLVTPPGGVVLDPFCGSGSTGRGAMLEGFGFVGVELDPESVRVARLRIAAVAK